MLFFANLTAKRPAAAPARAGSDRPQMSFALAATLTCAFTIFGLAAAWLVGWMYDAPALTVAVLIFSAAGALRRRRS
jgi:hypothetical protein